jgi:molybdenum cofactor guanylyltransferase
MYNGTPFWLLSLEAIKGITDNQVVVSHPSLFNRFQEDSEIQVILDQEEYRGNGPLAGIYSAMNCCYADWYVVLSCDIPKINASLIKHLLSFRSRKVDAVVPVINGKKQPLIALYNQSVKTIIEKQLNVKEFRIMSLLDKVETLYLSETDLNTNVIVFENVNTQDTLENLD